jgi:hypothetical protein
MLELFDSDHGRCECIGILCAKTKSVDPISITKLIGTINSDQHKNIALSHLTNISESILSHHVANILELFDSDHGKQLALKMLSSKITSISGIDFKDILKKFDSNQEKYSAIEVIRQKMSIDMATMIFISNQFDEEYFKALIIEQMSSCLQPSATKIPILTLWTSLDFISNEKKFTSIQQNIDSVDLKYTDVEKFCNSLHAICNDPKIFVSICELCNVPEIDYKTIIEQIAKENSIITICNKQYNVNNFEIGITYTFNTEDNNTTTHVEFTRELNNQAFVFTKTKNKKYNETSTCSISISLEKNMVI